MEVNIMKIIFKSEERYFEEELKRDFDIYDIISKGMVCMTFNKKTADIVVNDLREED